MPGKNSLSNLFSKSVEGLQFWSKNQSVVGIDIGSSSIKVIQLRKEKEQAVLETYGELALGPYENLAIGHTARLTEDKMIGVIKDLFKESGISARKGVVAMPLRSSFVTNIKLPVAGEKEMDTMIKFEARKYIPVSPEEIEMDWWVLPPSLKSKSGGNTEEDEQKEEEEEEKLQKRRMASVLLVAIHKETIGKYRKILTEIGLKDVAFEIEVFSVLRSVLSRQTVPVMTIDFGASVTRICIVDYGLLRVTHTVDKGSQELTNSISRALGISFERAEEMKFQIGLSPKPEHKELVGVMEPVLNFVFAEARQLMMDYRRKQNESIGKVILTGGGSLLTNLMDLAVKNLGVEVSLADPFSRVSYPPFLQEVLKEVGPSFSSATGAALRGL